MRINPLQLPDPAVGRQLRHYPHTSPIDAVAWSTDGSISWPPRQGLEDVLGESSGPPLQLELDDEWLMVGDASVEVNQF